MSKQEILNALNASGEVSNFRRTANWEKAFEMYNTAHGSRRSMNCGSCYRDVLQWLKS